MSQVPSWVFAAGLNSVTESPPKLHQVRENGAPLKILIVPALPTGAEARDQSIALLRAKGIDAVIPFRTMLAEIIEKTQTNRNYQKSDLLQVVRILKNYEFFKEPQMELFKVRKGRKSN